MAASYEDEERQGENDAGDAPAVAGKMAGDEEPGK
jgi:hypothetical protein